MAKWFALLLLTAVLAPACRNTQTVEVDTSQAQDIPRELAIEKLQTVLPTAYHFGLTDPSYRWRAHKIEKWVVDAEGFEVHPYDVQRYRLEFSSIISTRLDEDSKYSYVRLVTTEAKGETPDINTYFRWRRDPASARQALELFEALRRTQ